MQIRLILIKKKSH